MKLLALHSFRTNSSIFKFQISRAGLDKILPCDLELVYLDAPHAASGKLPKDVERAFGNSGPHLEWFTVEQMGDKVVFDEDKLDASTRLVIETLRERGPFDGIIGFSQGAMLGAAIVALMESQHPLSAGIPPFSFVIFIAGMKSRHPIHMEASKRSKIITPSIHLYGDLDEMREHNLALADACSSALILTHPRGHIVPSLEPRQVAALQGFIRSIQDSKVNSRL